MRCFSNLKGWLLALSVLPWGMAAAHDPSDPIAYQESCLAKIALPFKIEVFNPDSFDHMKKYWATQTHSLSKEKQNKAVRRNNLFAYLKKNYYPTPFHSWIFTSLSNQPHFMILVVNEMNPLGQVFLYINKVGPLSDFLPLTDPVRTCISKPLAQLLGQPFYSLENFSVDDFIKSANNLADIDQKLSKKKIASKQIFVEAVPFLDEKAHEDEQEELKQFFTLMGFYKTSLSAEGEKRQATRG